MSNTGPPPGLALRDSMSKVTEMFTHLGSVLTMNRRSEDANSSDVSTSDTRPSSSSNTRRPTPPPTNPPPPPPSLFDRIKQPSALPATSVFDQQQQVVVGVLHKWINIGSGWHPRLFILHGGVLKTYKVAGASAVDVLALLNQLRQLGELYFIGAEVSVRAALSRNKAGRQQRRSGGGGHGNEEGTTISGSNNNNVSRKVSTSASPDTSHRSGRGEVMTSSNSNTTGNAPSNPDTTPTTTSIRLPQPYAEVHLQVASLRESQTDSRRFYLNTGTQQLQLRAETQEDRWVWLEALRAAKLSFEGLSPAEATALRKPESNPESLFKRDTQAEARLAGLLKELKSSGVSGEVLEATEKAFKIEYDKFAEVIVAEEAKRRALLEIVYRLENEKRQLETAMVVEGRTSARASRHHRHHHRHRHSQGGKAEQQKQQQQQPLHVVIPPTSTLTSKSTARTTTSAYTSISSLDNGGSLSASDDDDDDDDEIDTEGDSEDEDDDEGRDGLLLSTTSSAAVPIPIFKRGKDENEVDEEFFECDDHDDDDFIMATSSSSGGGGEHLMKARSLENTPSSSLTNNNNNNMQSSGGGLMNPKSRSSSIHDLASLVDSFSPPPPLAAAAAAGGGGTSTPATVGQPIQPSSSSSQQQQQEQQHSSGIENKQLIAWLSTQQQQNNQRRLRLPPPAQKAQSVSLWALIRDMVGKDLTKVCLPVYFNEPLSVLQKTAEDLEYSELLDQAAAYPPKSMERLLKVAAFAVSAYGSTVGRTSKPFNPLLGETFEFVCPEKGFRFIAEKVSHHPTIIAAHAEGWSWTYYGDADLKSKFWGRSIELKPEGLLRLTFNDRTGDDGDTNTTDEYSWNKVTTSINNLILGKIYIDHGGVMRVRQHATGLTARIRFKETGMLFDRDPRQVKGYVEKGGKKYESPVIHGHWDHSLEATWDDGGGGGGGTTTTITSNTTTTTNNDNNDRRVMLLWKKNGPPPDPTRYNLTQFAIQLNELTPGLEKKVAPTDCRLRPDQAALERGEYDRANGEKQRLEHKQRAARRAAERGEPLEPRWFGLREVDDGWGGKVDGGGQEEKEGGEKKKMYVYTGGYWEEREGGEYSGCRDIFGA